MAGPCKPLSQSEAFPTSFNNAIAMAQHAWLSKETLMGFLRQAKELRDQGLPVVQTEPPYFPKAGSLYLIDKSECKRFRNDCHNYEKRADSNQLKDNHEKIKIGDKYVLKVYYSYVADSCKESTDHPLTRRVYWLLDSPDIVLIHYLHSPRKPYTVRPKERPAAAAPKKRGRSRGGAQAKQQQQQAARDAAGAEHQQELQQMWGADRLEEGPAEGTEDVTRLEQTGGSAPNTPAGLPALLQQLPPTPWGLPQPSGNHNPSYTWPLGHGGHPMHMLLQLGGPQRLLGEEGPVAAAAQAAEGEEDIDAFAAKRSRSCPLEASLGFLPPLEDISLGAELSLKQLLSLGGEVPVGPADHPLLHRCLSAKDFSLLSASWIPPNLTPPVLEPRFPPLDANPEAAGPLGGTGGQALPGSAPPPPASLLKEEDSLAGVFQGAAAAPQQLTGEESLNGLLNELVRFTTEDMLSASDLKWTEEELRVIENSLWRQGKGQAEGLAPASATAAQQPQSTAQHNTAQRNTVHGWRPREQVKAGAATTATGSPK